VDDDDDVMEERWKMACVDFDLGRGGDTWGKMSACK